MEVCYKNDKPFHDRLKVLEIITVVLAKPTFKSSQKVYGIL